MSDNAKRDTLPPLASEGELLDAVFGGNYPTADDFNASPGLRALLDIGQHFGPAELAFVNQLRGMEFEWRVMAIQLFGKLIGVDVGRGEK